MIGFKVFKDDQGRILVGHLTRRKGRTFSYCIRHYIENVSTIIPLPLDREEKLLDFQLLRGGSMLGLVI